MTAPPPSRVVLRAAPYRIEVSAGVRWHTVTGWTADALHPFAVREHLSPEDSPATLVWRIDHCPSGRFIADCETREAAVTLARRYARATVDGAPVDWALPLRQLAPRLRRLVLPEPEPVAVVEADDAGGATP